MQREILPFISYPDWRTWKKPLLHKVIEASKYTKNLPDLPSHILCPNKLPIKYALYANIMGTQLNTVHFCCLHTQCLSHMDVSLGECKSVLHIKDTFTDQ